MNGEHNGPIINSRHHGNLPKPNRGLYVIFGLLVVFSFAIAGFFITVEEKSVIQEDAYLYEDKLDFEAMSENIIDTTIVQEEVTKEEEGTTPEFYYQRALEKEKAQDYEGAIEDYTKTIELASRYSNEMFNALNNRGVIRSQQLKDYKLAQKDFNKIVEIETNRSDGNAVMTRLEAAYSNRAFVKKMRGDKDGACNDLYDALANSTAKSAGFIEKQIENNCW